ncbi:MAG: four helix bundle protein [Cyclobacteriaceae bacterium]
MITNLEEFKAYNRAMELGDNVWKVVMSWDYFAKDTIGKQLVKSADSVAANLSEGLGRYHFKEAKNFSYYSRGSLFETKTWLVKAYNRNLIDETLFKNFIDEIEQIGRMINGYIKSIGYANEPEETYGD